SFSAAVASSCLLSVVYCSGAHRDLHSFPTRRSSDLEVGATSGERVEVRLLRQQPRDLFWMALASLALAGLAWVAGWPAGALGIRSEEHTSELQSRENLVCRLLLEKKKEMTTRRVQTM